MSYICVQYCWRNNSESGEKETRPYTSNDSKERQRWPALNRSMGADVSHCMVAVPMQADSAWAVIVNDGQAVVFQVGDGTASESQLNWQLDCLPLR